MVSEFPAGLDRGVLVEIMRLDPTVSGFEKVDGAEAMWTATLSVEGGEPVNVIVDNGINEIYVQALIRLDWDEITPVERQLVIAAAMAALEPYATVGLTEISGGVYLRSAFFIDFSNIHAFTNMLKGIALSYAAYNRQIPITAATFQE